LAGPGGSVSATESDAELDEAMDPYRAGKGTLRFPFGEPLPTALIEDVVRRLHRDLGSI